MVLGTDPYGNSRFGLVYLDYRKNGRAQIALGDVTGYTFDQMFDPEGNLYLGDWNWNRVLIYRNLPDAPREVRPRAAGAGRTGGPRAMKSIAPRPPRVSPFTIPVGFPVCVEVTCHGTCGVSVTWFHTGTGARGEGGAAAASRHPAAPRPTPRSSPAGE